MSTHAARSEAKQVAFAIEERKIASATAGSFRCNPSITTRKSDADLLRNVDAGDTRAMQELFARHNVCVHRFVLRLVDDKSLAEEVVNDVFIGVWRNAGRFKGECRVSTWLLAVARFKALSSLRRRRDEQLDGKSAAAILDPSDDPETLIQKKDQAAVLRQCVSRLSDHHRKIIDLIYYGDKSIAEAAEITGVSHNTAKTRIFHARRRMTALLHEAGIN
jgi:RNA polymerase sigma-70 factor, ECF subfamily